MSAVGMPDLSIYSTGSLQQSLDAAPLHAVCSMETLFYDRIEGNPDASFRVTRTQHRLVCSVCNSKEATPESCAGSNKQHQTSCLLAMEDDERKLAHMYFEILQPFKSRTIPLLVRRHMQHCVGTLQLTCTMHGQGSCLLCNVQRYMMKIFAAMEHKVFACSEMHMLKERMRTSVCASATMLFRSFVLATSDVDDSALDFADAFLGPLLETDQRKVHNLCVQAASCYSLISKDMLGFCQTKSSLASVLEVCSCNRCTMATLCKKSHRVLQQQIADTEQRIFIATLMEEQGDSSRRNVVFPACTFVDILEQYKDWRHKNVCVVGHGVVECRCEEVLPYARRMALRAVMDWDNYSLCFIADIRDKQATLQTRELRATNNQFVSFDPIAVAAQSMKMGASVCQFEKRMLMLALGTHHRVGAMSALRLLGADSLALIAQAILKEPVTTVSSCDNYFNFPVALTSTNWSQLRDTAPVALTKCPFTEQLVAVRVVICNGYTIGVRCGFQ